MSIYDTETFIKELETLFKDNLNTEIGIINTEKGDFSIPTINTGAWFFQNLEDDAFNYEEFVLWGLGEASDVTETQQGNFIRVIKVVFEVVIPDDGSSSDENVTWKLFRYARGLEAVALKNYDQFHGKVKIKVNSLVPTAFQFESKIIKSAGIEITASITAI